MPWTLSFLTILAGFTILIASSPTVSSLAERYKLSTETLVKSDKGGGQLETGTSLSNVFRNQFTNPKDVLTVLLLIGGDTIQKAIAQLAGHKVVPVAFSFGWVGYAFGALASVFGQGTLMPTSELVSSVIDIKSENSRVNESWVVGRLVRDLEKKVEREFKTATEGHIKDNVKRGFHRPADKYDPSKQRRLVITVYKTARGASKPAIDRIWKLSLGLIIVQLFISSIPWWLSSGNWSIFMITLVGSTVATFHGTCIGQWKKEKFACRANSKRDYAITRGNGHKHIFVILNGEIDVQEILAKDDKEKESKEVGISLNLEDLATITPPAPDSYTRIASVLLALFWIILLITVSALEEDAWFLLASGGVGMVNNMLVATLPRSSRGHGAPLQPGKLEQYGDGHMDGLKVLELAEHDYAGLGLALRPMFYPGASRNEIEEKTWANFKRTLEERKKTSRLRLVNLAGGRSTK